MAKRKRSSAKRTKKGSVTASARKRYGMKGKGKRGKFPVFDTKSARNALRLRGRGKGVSRKAVIAKVSAFANRTGNSSLKAAVSRARAADKRR